MNKQINLITNAKYGFDSYGFTNAQNNIKKALELKNVKFNVNSNIELWHISAHLYNKGTTKSFLWFPYEANVVPDFLVRKANEASSIIASNEFSKDTFQKCGITPSIDVCQLGIDTNIFKYKKERDTDNFTFLWIGQNSMRKGWDIVVKAFQETFTTKDNVKLYIKTVGKTEQGLYQLYDNVYFDSRSLALADILDLYYNASVFVFPSRGEGSGLPAMEAMSTGCLVMAPAIQGMKDFVLENTSIPCEYEQSTAHFGATKITVPNVKYKELGDKMREVYQNYDKYDNIRKIGSQLILDKYSLNILGNNLLRILWS